MIGIKQVIKYEEGNYNSGINTVHWINIKVLAEDGKLYVGSAKDVDPLDWRVWINGVNTKSAN